MVITLTLATLTLASQSLELTAAAVPEVYIQLRFRPLFNVIKDAGSTALHGNIICTAEYSHQKLWKIRARPL